MYILLFSFLVAAAIGLITNSQETGAPKNIGRYNGIPSLIVLFFITEIIEKIVIVDKGFITTAFAIIAGYIIGNLLRIRENEKETINKKYF